MRTVESIESEIIDLENQLENVEGREAEVYTRIVGYYRAVKNWNKGKKEEYNQRVCFSDYDRQEEKNTANTDIPEKNTVNDINILNAVKYSYYFRKTCPNCPSVKGYVETLDLSGEHIDVDTAKGLSSASDSQVFGVPTVVFYDDSNNEVFRAHNLKDLKNNVNTNMAFAV